MKKVLAGALGLGLWCGPALLLAQSQNKTQSQPQRQQMSQDMREAIAFEHAKDVADARQARMEARHPSVPVPGDEHSANRSEEENPGAGRPVTDAGPGKVKHENQ